MGYYEVLGLSREAVGLDPSSLKSAYKRRALEVHPDKPGGNLAEFQSVARAYQVLANETLRTVVDTFHPCTVDDPEDVVEEINALFPGMELDTACAIYKILSPLPSRLGDLTETEVISLLKATSENCWHSRKKVYKIAFGIIYFILILIHIFNS